MERPTIEVSLTTSGMKAIVYTYLTRGERKAIEAIMLESAVFEQVGDTAKLKSIDISYKPKMEDKAILLAVKHFTTADGATLETSQKVIDELPQDDFDILHKMLNKPIEPEAKKKDIMRRLRTS